MSSVIFQPLLHDPLGWKAPNSTYSDVYTWKMERPNHKEKKISPYGQQYQREMRKQQKLQEKNASLPSVLSAVMSEEQTIQPLVLVKDNRSIKSASHRSSPSKTPPIVSEEPSAIQRPPSIIREGTTVSKTSQRSLVAGEETDNPTASVDAQSSSKEEQQQQQIPIDLNDDQTRHWLTYPNPKTPQYIIDIRHRLGQLKIPSAPIRSTSIVNDAGERIDFSSAHRLHKSADHRHMFDFNLPQTPDELRASRHRLEKHRYNPALDNYPTRPKTCPVRSDDSPKPPQAAQSPDEQAPPPPPPTEISPVENPDLPTTEENKPNEHETSTSSIQMVDIEGAPTEYVDAVQTANIAQEEYLKAIRSKQEKRNDYFGYRLTSMPTDSQSESAIAYRQQQQSKPSVNQNTTRSADFGTWVRNATDKERQSAMKILRDVLHQPIVGYDIPIKSLKANRSTSAPRKLGRTRKPHQRTVCEICEKQMIKRHVWNMNRSDTLTCIHQAQGIKPPIIQIRA